MIPYDSIEAHVPSTAQCSEATGERGLLSNDRLGSIEPMGAGGSDSGT